jgi:hypothetical protein
MRVILSAVFGQHVNDEDAKYLFKIIVWFALYAIGGVMLLGRVLE